MEQKKSANSYKVRCLTTPNCDWSEVETNFDSEKKEISEDTRILMRTSYFLDWYINEKTVGYLIKL